MKTLINNDEQFDEIVFQDRNKNYGAYYLRKVYNKHISKALFITVAFSMIICSMPLVAHYFKKNSNYELKPVSYEFSFTDLKKPVKEINKVQIESPKNVLENAVSFRVFKPVWDSIEEYSSFIMDDINKKNIAYKIDSTLNSDTFLYFDPEIVTEIEDNTIHTVVEEMPYFPQGESELMSFFRNNVIYPEPERDLGIMGVVVVSFVVEPDGSISNINIYKGETDNLNSEAIRLVSQMPEWEPGKQNGVKVRVAINLPIRFTLM